MNIHSTTKSQSPLEKYEETQSNIRELLKEIEAGLERHDHKAREIQLNWAHVGDLVCIEKILNELKDRLQRTGEYARS